MWHKLLLSLFLAKILVLPVCDGFSDAPEWNILKLAQIWPPASCFYLEEQHQTCSIPESVMSWTVHGLWPTQEGTLGPNYCNNTWKFNLQQVQVLRPLLDIKWPSFSVQDPLPNNWQHEWEKHGTCGTSVQDLRDELHYFNTTLQLHQKYSLQSLLASRGIVPSSSVTYTPDAVLTALHDILGVYPNVICVRDEKEKQSYLETVEICMTRDFGLIDCSGTYQQKNRLTHQENQILRKMSVSLSDIEDCDKSGVFYKPFAQK
ncbi:ribonuclease Oy-like [Pomacea canaliculata]|uniref:ribonuclease Oy-like n=1 Tax=Pomacea canaliculata TaxID=400727 RepID=UPI000D732E01|nr:ribonuclease Oy-like [Pomacea canaliculata]XP_025105481.1 ribonuclease Oy-like [Pomacea canaliculata]